MNANTHAAYRYRPFLEVIKERERPAKWDCDFKAYSPADHVIERDGWKVGFGLRKSYDGTTYYWVECYGSNHGGTDSTRHFAFRAGVTNAGTRTDAMKACREIIRSVTEDGTFPPLSVAWWDDFCASH